MFKKIAFSIVTTILLLVISGTATTSVRAATNAQTATLKIDSPDSVLTTQTAIAHLLMWTDGSTNHYETVNYVPPIRLIKTFHPTGTKTYYEYGDANHTLYYVPF
ncbi:hypothetical protein [Schleiferilactobacillus shenzhenensis]|uniref:MucBP domain-containing protein n=1 Tax=Schleiferilactobacillus shenzhenensis LY-73 TaxID=1231336 RepID=U4TL84_9LACO|nr:hypothetical protein [Schleiferilactobacillus shenzhenensis]ERL64954.1 hypothetical protein L248_3116 [Schleiferilactobacillus shenzhenensis LY-73]